MPRLSVLPLAPLALLASACGGADTAAVIDTVRATEQAQLEALAAADLRGIERIYAQDARLVQADGSVLEGQAAIKAQYEQLLADPNFSLTLEPRDGWASASDDLAVLTSRITFVTSDPETGDPVARPFHTQTVWRRVAGTGWQTVSAFNAPDAP